MSKVIYRVYRPKTFQEVSGQEHVVKTIQNQHATDALAHAYLFTGPRGVGKTTLARLVAKLANCLSPKEHEPCNACRACENITSGKALDVIEIDAASQSDVENVRDNIIQAIRFAPQEFRKKVFIIDEVHMLSGSAFNALLKTLEEPPEHALFILATTEIHKVPETIISRCQRFDFRKIPAQILVERLARIVQEEGIHIHKEVLEEIVRCTEGCARDAESLLGQVLALGEKEISMKEASLVLPATQSVLIEAFLTSLFAHEAKTAVSLLNTYLDQGVDLVQFINDTIRLARDKLLDALSNQNTQFDIVFLQRIIEELLLAQRSIRHEYIPQLPIEIAIIKLCGIPEQKQIVSDFQTQEVDSGWEREEITKTTQKETVFDTVPVISLDEVKEKWPQVYEQIKSCNASLPLFMQSCEVAGIEGNRVELGFEYGLYAETVNQEKNRRIIEDVCEKVMGTPLRIKAIQSKRAVQDETVVSLLEEFGGRVQ